MEFTPQHVVAVVLWILWCSLHSLLIAVPVTDYLKKQFEEWYRYYRLVYNLLALVSIAPVMLYSISIETTPIFHWEGALTLIRYMLASVSICLFIAGARHYRLSKIVGIDQIRTGKTSRLLTEHNVLSTTGILGIIRHPWYAGSLLIVWTREIGLVGLSTNILLSLYLVIGAFLEEGKLLKEFGDAYRQYQNRVSMLFPYKWIRSKF
jgi:methanethiol S-methyltransferase